MLDSESFASGVGMTPQGRYHLMTKLAQNAGALVGWEGLLGGRVGGDESLGGWEEMGHWWVGGVTTHFRFF